MHNELERILIQKINDNGSIDLGQFIEIALSHPEHGYYMRSDPFGANGDFTTAPEISQMFGEVIGARVSDIWMQMGKPSTFNIIECGAGRGTLMADIMRSCKSVSGFNDAAHICIVETSNLLRDLQKDALNTYQLNFYNNILDIPIDHTCIILGNEFLDALPIEQLKFGKLGWQKRVVSVVDNKIIFDWQDADKKLTELLPLKFESNRIYEVSPSRELFIDNCSNIIKKASGVALFIDYGYSKSHYGDTLQAVKKHEFTNVLEDIGLSDITSHIDFNALSRQVKKLELMVEPIISQREFLISSGIELRAKILQQNVSKDIDITEDLERLIGRNQMGELFKVICFHKLGSK